MTNDNMSVYCRQCWSFAAAFMSTANILIKALQPWPFDRLDRTTGCSWTICCRTCLRGTICPVPVVALGQLCWLLPAKLGSGMGRTVWISTVVGVPFLGPLGNPTPMHLFGIRRNPLEDPPLGIHQRTAPVLLRLKHPWVASIRPNPPFPEASARGCHVAYPSTDFCMTAVKMIHLKGSAKLNHVKRVVYYQQIYISKKIVYKVMISWIMLNTVSKEAPLLIVLLIGCPFWLCSLNIFESRHPRHSLSLARSSIASAKLFGLGSL